MNPYYVGCLKQCEIIIDTGAQTGLVVTIQIRHHNYRHGHSYAIVFSKASPYLFEIHTYPRVDLLQNYQREGR